MNNQNNWSKLNKYNKRLQKDKNWKQINKGLQKIN